MFKTLLIFGPPGSGKGTLGVALAKATGSFHISSGDIFRGKKLFQEYIDKGLLVPDESAIEIWRAGIEEKISSGRYNPHEQALLSDGIPRTRRQAEICDEILDVQQIILLDVPEEVLIRRMQGRGRADDADIAVLHKRFEVYRSQTAETLEHYDPSLVLHINGDQMPEAVLKEALERVTI